MPNNRNRAYDNYDYNTPRKSHYGEGRRLRDRNRDYFDDYNDFEDNTEANFSYADDDDNPIYAQPGFSGERSWSERRSPPYRGRSEERTSSRYLDSNKDHRRNNMSIDRQMNRRRTDAPRSDDTYSRPYYDDFEVYDVDRDQRHSENQARRSYEGSRFDNQNDRRDFRRNGSRRSSY